MTELSDQSLLTHWYRHRNAEAFHVLATRHARMVYATALRVLRDSQAAEDVSQESFLALAQAKRPPSRNVAAWLHRTAYHAALDAIRSGKRRQARDMDYAATQPQVAHTTWDDMRGFVDEAVASLPEAWREPLVRHFFEQESHAAIAAALGIPRQTVTHRIGKGIEQVRQQLKQKGVIAPAGALLVAMIQENSVSALPTSAAAGIGRIALVATPSMAAVLATYTTGAALKVAAVVLVVGVGAVVSLAVVGREAPRSPDAQRVVAEATVVPAAPPPAIARPAARAETGAVLTTVSNEAPAPEIVAANVDDDSTKASLSGVVLLPDGKPYARATIWVQVVRDEPTRLPEGRSYRTEADDRGRFEQTGIVPGEYGVFVTEPGTMGVGPNNELEKISLTAGEQRKGLSLQFGSEGNLTISGIVVNTAGEPIQSVEIVTPGRALRQATTDEKGHFSLRNLPDDQIAIFAADMRYENGAAAAHAGDQNVRIVLTAKGSVTGHVVDAKTRKPVLLFEAAHMERHTETYSEGLFNPNTTFSSSEGTFKLEYVSSGNGTIVVRAKGYAPAFEHITLEEGKTLEGLEIALQEAPLLTVSGRVVTLDGAPVSGARIYMDPVSSMREFRGDNVAAVSDAEGQFHIQDARPNLESVYAWQAGYAAGVGAVSENTVIVLQKSATLIVDLYSNGEPMPRIRLSATVLGAPNAGGASGATTDESGHAVIEEIGSGKVQLQTVLSDNRARYDTLNLSPGEEKTLRIDVPAGEAGVEGVVQQDGAPVSSGFVRLFVNTPLGPERFEQGIEPDGTFRFAHVPLGTAQLVARTGKPAIRNLVDEVSLVAGEITSLTVDMTATAGISGIVAGVREAHLSRVAIIRGAVDAEEAQEIAGGTAFDANLASRVEVDESGAFEAALQAPGTYTLVLSSRPTTRSSNYEDNDVRIVEVPESGELDVNFSLPQ